MHNLHSRRNFQNSGIHTFSPQKEKINFERAESRTSRIETKTIQIKLAT